MPDEHDDAGLDLARVIARSLAGASRRTTTGPRRSGGPRPGARAGGRGGPGGYSGAHPDERDPQTLDTSLGRLVSDQGWDTELRVHGVFGRWSALVGEDVAVHVTPESYADGRLVCRTDSTAWATQLRLLAGTLLRRLNEELGDGTVTVIDVLGPRAPRWTSGRLRVKGPGPRDTYG